MGTSLDEELISVNALLKVLVDVATSPVTREIVANGLEVLAKVIRP